MRGGVIAAGRGRRVRAAAAVLASATFALGAARIWPAEAAATPDTNLENYALFAYTRIDIKGGNGTQTEIGGNVGVKFADPDPDSSPPSLGICRGGGGRPLKVLDGYQVVADTIDTTDKCDFDDLFVNRMTGSPNVRGSQSTWTPPLPMTIPSPGPFTCDPQNPSMVDKNTAVTVPPGTYGEAHWKDGSTVTLSDGVYVFCSLRTGRNARVITSAGVDIRVAQTAHLGDDSDFGTACDSRVYVRGDGVSPNDNTTNFSHRNVIWGTWMTPNGKVALGNGTDLHGRFWGFDLHDDFNMQVHLCPRSDPPTTTTSTSTTSTTTTTVPEPTTTTTTTSTTTSTSTTTTTVPEPTTTTTVPEPTTTTTVPEPTTTIVTAGTTATLPSTTTTTVEATATTGGPLTTTTAGPRPLPRTGSDTGPPLAGLASVVAGLSLVVATRRRCLRRL
jgi:hypothetical protein